MAATGIVLITERMEQHYERAALLSAPAAQEVLLHLLARVEVLLSERSLTPSTLEHSLDRTLKVAARGADARFPSLVADLGSAQ